MSGGKDTVVCSLVWTRFVVDVVCLLIQSCSFFPNQPILESGAVELLCGLTQSENPALRVNGIWALMVCAIAVMPQLTGNTEAKL